MSPATPRSAESPGGDLPPALDHGPFLRAPDASGSLFVVIFAAACGPLAAGVVFFGWRALLVAALSVLGCVATEALYYRVRRTPALLGRSHAALTGLLLGLTLPAFAPWYVPLAGSVFAIIVGKALFGGVGHFLWQPALVGRLAVAVVFAPPLFSVSQLDRPEGWPVLARNHVILGDVTNVDPGRAYRRWRLTATGTDRDAIVRQRPRDILRSLTSRDDAPAESIMAVLRDMPPAWDLICGAHGGGIGETCVLVILVAGLYLVYRNHFRGLLPASILAAAAVTAAVAPVRTGDGLRWQWLPLTLEGFQVGAIYVAYHLVCGELMLAAWFLATEMTSRPVTTPAQVIYGVVCGTAAILMRLYLDVPIPAYAAVLLANTFTPLLDAVIHPRVLGQRRWYRRIFS